MFGIAFVFCASWGHVKSCDAEILPLQFDNSASCDLVKPTVAANLSGIITHKGGRLIYLDIRCHRLGSAPA